MNFASLNASWRLASLSNKILLVANLLLACVAFVLAGAAVSTRERVTVVPPTIDKPYVVGWSSATPEYHKSMAMYFTGMIGSVSPKTVDYVTKTIEMFSAPEVAQEFKRRLRAIASDYEFRQSTASAWFEGERVAWEEKTGKVFVIGRLMTATSNNRVTSKDAVYEYRIEIREGQPVITHFDSYEGNMPHTLAWHQDKGAEKKYTQAVEKKAQQFEEKETALDLREANQAAIEEKSGKAQEAAR